MSEELYELMARAVLDGEMGTAAELAQRGLDAGLPASDILNLGFVKGIEEVGECFGRGEFFLPELSAGAECMKAALVVLKPALQASKEGRQVAGTAVAGTVQGDIHEIGKTIVCSMLSAAGFKVTDMGPNVSPASFVEKASELKPQLLLLSSLLTTTMPFQRATIEALEEAGLRGEVKVMVGGAPVTPEWADEIGADGFAEDAIEAVAVARKLVAGAESNSA